MDYLQRILHDKLIPHAKTGASERVIVARPQMDAADMPSGVKLIYRKIPGKRVIVRGGRLYGNVRLISAKWPEAGMHEVEEPRLIYVTDGQVRYQVGNYVLECKEGDFILLPARTPHPGNNYIPRIAHCSVPGGTCRLLFMALHRRGFQCWTSSYTNEERYDDATKNYLFLNTQALQIFSLFIEELLQEKNEQLCNSLLLALGTVLQREVNAGAYLHPGPVVVKEATPPTDTAFLQQLESYVWHHLNEQMTLESLARQFHMSRTQFSQRIRRETNKSLVEFLTDYRLREAKILLAESEWTVQAISHFLGFKSSTYFHALFQRHMGCTPGEFRSEVRRKTPNKIVR